MLLIGNGLLANILNAYTFIFAAIIVNMVVGMNYRKQILSGCHCAYSKDLKDQILTLGLLFFLSFGVVIMSADISYSLSMIWFSEKPEPIKTHYINLFVTSAVAFSNLLFKTIVLFLNKNGIKLAERFTNIFDKDKTKDKEDV